MVATEKYSLWQVRVGDRWKYVEPELAASASGLRPGEVRLADVPAGLGIEFRRTPRFAPAGVTPRRLAAAKKALAAQRDRAPLFAHLIAAEQSTPYERVRLFNEASIEGEIESRIRTAGAWRSARRVLRSLPVERQAVLLALWRDNFYPKTPDWFARFLDHHQQEVG